MAANPQMRVTILGSGTCVPSLERRPCSILVQCGGVNILIDAGPGVIGQLLKAGVNINAIDLILLSHFHLDHCADVAPILFAMKYAGLDQSRQLILAGGTGLNDHLARLNHAHGQTIDITDMNIQTIELAQKGLFNTMLDRSFPVKISYAPTAHKPESRAYRLVDATGKSLVYSGDTDVCDALSVLAHQADIFICEASFPDEHKASGHLTPGLAGEIASNAGVKRLVLTHFYPACDHIDVHAQCRRTFDGAIILASDLLCLDTSEGP
jgi:ribonuclease BN (tRNA processing enzyme)